MPRARAVAILTVCLGGWALSVGAAFAADGLDGASVTRTPAPAAVFPGPAPEERPAAARIELGRSVDGRPIVMELFGEGDEHVLVVGGIHGNEPTGVYVARRLARFLRDHPKEFDGRTIGVVPEANPDGLSRGTRANAHGVDLNRNFPSENWCRAASSGVSHGTHPASEPETQAILRAVKMVQPQRIVDVHSIPAGFHCNNYDGPAEPLARLMSRFNDYPVEADIGYPTPGALGSWAGVDCGIPSITLELPRGISGEDCWENNQDALLAFADADEAQPERVQLASEVTEPAHRVATAPPTAPLGAP